MKKLIVLLGDTDLKNEVAGHIVADKLAVRRSLLSEPLETIAYVLKQPVESFYGDKLDEPFASPILIVPGMLARFASRLAMGILPVSFAGNRVNTPREAVVLFLEAIGATRWGADWLVRRFADEYAYVKGMSIMTDAEGQQKHLVQYVGKENVFFVGLATIKESGEVVENFDQNSVNIVIDHDTSKPNAKHTALNVLTEIKKELDK